jgi:hypothetical protein
LVFESLNARTGYGAAAHFLRLDIYRAAAKAAKDFGEEP